MAKKTEDTKPPLLSDAEVIYYQDCILADTHDSNMVFRLGAQAKLCNRLGRWMQDAAKHATACHSWTNPDFCTCGLDDLLELL